MLGQQHDKPIQRLLFWAPRVLCILFAAFVSVFALDVFNEGYGFWQTFRALLIHLIPTWIILLALIVSWRWEWIGAVLFTGLGVFYIATNWGRLAWSAYLTISGPLVVLGILFLLNWIWRAKLRTA